MLADCLWTEWMYSRCSATCGEGTRTAFRKVKKPAAVDDNGKVLGKQCVDHGSKQETCNIQACSTQDGNTKCSQKNDIK